MALVFECSIIALPQLALRASSNALPDGWRWHLEFSSLLSSLSGAVLIQSGARGCGRELEVKQSLRKFM